MFRPIHRATFEYLWSMPPRFPPARLAAAGFSPVLTQVATAPCTRCRSGLNPRMHTPSEERAQPPHHYM